MLGTSSRQPCTFHPNALRLHTLIAGLDALLTKLATHSKPAHAHGPRGSTPTISNPTIHFCHFSLAAPLRTQHRSTARGHRPCALPGVPPPGLGLRPCGDPHPASSASTGIGHRPRALPGVPDPGLGLGPCGEPYPASSASTGTISPAALATNTPLPL